MSPSERLTTRAGAPVARNSQPPRAEDSGPGGSLFGLLLKQVREAGPLERRSGHYIRRVAATALLLVTGWTAFFLVGDSWWQLVIAMFLAFVFTQLDPDIENGALAAHIAGYLTVVFLVLSPLKALAFIAVQQGLFGLYLGCSFAPNHKGMAILSADDRTDHAQALRHLDTVGRAGRPTRT